MTILNKEQCSDCKFFMHVQGNNENGVCRRMPPLAFPVLTPQGMIPVSNFAIVQKAAWCGEYKTKLTLNG
jgi:hypothetical protein